MHPETKIIIGGWMPTLIPEHVLRLSRCDAVIRGEGERSLPELVRRIDDKEWSIKGVSYRVPGQDSIKHNPNSIALTQKEFDDLPMPRYDVLPPLGRYFRGDNPCFTVEASRGCTHSKCIFCWNSTRNCDTRWRAKSPRRVVKEIRWFHDTYGSSIFFFADDSFGARADWLSEFVSQMNAEFRPGEVGYVASMRIDALDVKKLRALRRSGLRTVFHGVESGSKECWRTLAKGFDPEINRQYILGLAKKEMEAGIVPIFSFIAGIPNETEKDLDETVSLCRQLTDLGALITAQILAPHQGTTLFKSYSDLIEPYDVYGELGRSESFQHEYYSVFGDRLKEFLDYLPDFKRVRPSMSLDRFIEKYSLLPGSIVKPRELG
jgi:magnesium-protoporphyrin IX monomethyl ester (oxidative) cyclase